MIKVEGEHKRITRPDVNALLKEWPSIKRGAVARSFLSLILIWLIKKSDCFTTSEVAYVSGLKDLGCVRKAIRGVIKAINDGQFPLKVNELHDRRGFVVARKVLSRGYLSLEQECILIATPSFLLRKIRLEKAPGPSKLYLLKSNNQLSTDTVKEIPQVIKGLEDIRVRLSSYRGQSWVKTVKIGKDITQLLSEMCERAIKLYEGIYDTLVLKNTYGWLKFFIGQLEEIQSKDQLIHKIDHLIIEIKNL